METNQDHKFIKMAPVLMFVAGYFFFHLFDWIEATHIIWATWVSLATFMFLAVDLKMEHKGKASFKKLSFYSGLLTLISVIMFLQGFVHWYRWLPKMSRVMLLFSVLLIFFFVLFRAMRILLELKIKLESNEKTKNSKPERK